MCRLLDRLIYGLNELVGGPGTGRGAPAAIKVQSRSGRFDLFERAALFLQVLKPVANDIDHVPVVGDVGHITDAAPAGDDDSASLRPEFRVGDVQNLSQSINLAVHRSAL